jgi:hypothetical protein
MDISEKEKSKVVNINSKRNTTEGNLAVNNEVRVTNATKIQTL